jgi:hypothetical protein
MQYCVPQGSYLILNVAAMQNQMGDTQNVSSYSWVRPAYGHRLDGPFS